METLTHKFIKRHNEIRRLLNAIDRIKLHATDEKRILVDDLQKTLHAHLSAEELVLYRKIDDFQDEELSIMVARGREEHELFQFLFERMNQNWPNTPTWQALFDIYKDNIETYLHREEGRLLPISDKIIPHHQMEDILAKTEKTEDEWRSGSVKNSDQLWEVPPQ